MVQWALGQAMVTWQQLSPACRLLSAVYSDRGQRTQNKGKALGLIHKNSLQVDLDANTRGNYIRHHRKEAHMSQTSSLTEVSFHRMNTLRSLSYSYIYSYIYPSLKKPLG